MKINDRDVALTHRSRVEVLIGVVGIAGLMLIAWWLFIQMVDLLEIALQNWNANS